MAVLDWRGFNPRFSWDGHKSHLDAIFPELGLADLDAVRIRGAVPMSMDASDFICSGVISSCCGGNVLRGGMCAECGEHCELVDEANEMREEDNPKPERAKP